jgi:hypothetical protein
MTGIPGGAGTGGDLSIGPALDKLRRDNALTDQVIDPSEDEPHIVGIPKKYQRPAGSEDPHS